jgi:hypothetical protein
MVRTSSKTAAGIASSGAPVEPLLEMNEIQGIAVPGFFKPHQTLIYIRFPSSDAGLVEIRRALRRLIDTVSSAAQTLADRRDHRTTDGDVAADVQRRVFTAMSFSAAGLHKEERATRPPWKAGLLIS